MPAPGPQRPQLPAPVWPESLHSPHPRRPQSVFPRCPQPHPCRAPCGRALLAAGARVPRIAWTAAIIRRVLVNDALPRASFLIRQSAMPQSALCPGRQAPSSSCPRCRIACRDDPAPRLVPIPPSPPGSSPTSARLPPIPPPIPCPRALRARSSGGGRTDSQDRMDRSHHAAGMVNEPLPLASFLIRKSPLPERPSPGRQGPQFPGP